MALATSPFPHAVGKGSSDPPSLTREREKSFITLRLCPLVVQGIPQDASRQRSGMAPVFEQYLAIDDGAVNAGGEFPDAPPTGRKIMHHVLRQRPDGVGIEHGDIGRQARP